MAKLAGGDAARRLNEVSLSWLPVDQNVAAATLFRRRFGDRPLFVGLIGGASSGKSTLFNSLVCREVSRISAHAHETLGPIAAVHHRWGDPLDTWIREQSVFPGYQPAAISNGEPTTGEIGRAFVCRHDESAIQNVVLVDLPDVTSALSVDEGSISHALLPWFDALIIVVDEERWFDATVFDGIVETARELNPSLWIVFNQTDSSRTCDEDDRRKLADHVQLRHANSFCVSPYQPGWGYRPMSDAARSEVVDWLSHIRGQNRESALEAYLRRRCSEILSANVTRIRRFDELKHNVDLQLAELSRETRLTTDLLTSEEKTLLGIGHRFIPLYGWVRDIGRRLVRISARGGAAAIDFDKRTDALANILQRNLEQRFRHATARIDETLNSASYIVENNIDAKTEWTLPELDSFEWARRIRAHIDAFKTENAQLARRGDLAAVSISVPLLVADLLFLGGAGVTLTWATAWVAGLFGGKGIVSLMHRSESFKEYQTSVRTYQEFVRDALTRQCSMNLARIPQTHLPITDPIVQSMLTCSNPKGRLEA